MRLSAASWTILEGFAPEAASVGGGWTDFDTLEDAASRAIGPAAERALLLCQRWEERTSHLGTTPSDRDWTQFRQLRLGREEDWSDWLAFLLEGAPPGILKEMLGVEGSCGDVCREVQADEYRADLVLEFPNTRVSVEIKLQDPDLSKTPDCCARLEKTYPGPWKHLILLPEERSEEWEAQQRPSGPEIELITWTKVALALRRSLWRQEGNLAWRCWALAYCGAVEQSILELPSRRDLAQGPYPTDLSRVVRLFGHLNAAMREDDAGTR